MRTILLNLLKRPKSTAVTPPPQDRAHFFNRKITDPSRLMNPADGNRYHCPWLDHGMTVHSDGNVTCGLDDPHGRRSFGNIRRIQDALKFAERACELDGNDSINLSTLASALVLSGDKAKAIEVYEKVIGLPTITAETHKTVTELLDELRSNDSSNWTFRFKAAPGGPER